jgi:pyruvate,water dikinase
MFWLNEAVDIGIRHFCMHWELNLTQFISFLIYDQVYSELIGDVPEEIRNLPLKTDKDKNMEVLNGIWMLKEKVKKDSELKKAFMKESKDVLIELKKNADGREFIKSLEEFLRKYGNKAIYVFEFINPSWREDPTQVIELIKSYLEIDYNYPMEVRKITQERETAEKEALSKIKSVEEKKKFTNALKTAHALAPITPNHHFYIDQWTPVAMRRVFLKIGEKLSENNVLDKAEDVFFLTLDQVKEIMSNLKAFNAKEVVEEAKKTWEEQSKLSPPPNLGTITEASANDIVKIKLWGWTLPKEKEIVKNKLRGVAASPGIIEGVAKVVKSPKEFGLVEKGDILVCDLTNPAWTPLFIKISGVVTNSGGILSHPGILSREFKIPCVVGTVHATKAIRSGQKIRVDGSRGTVEILS